MGDAVESAESRITPVKRVGFWLGLLLFALILAMPTLQSVQRLVSDEYGPAIRLDVARAMELPTDAAGPIEIEQGVTWAAFQHAVGESLKRRERVIVASVAVTALVACWWITVAIPIPVTSLLPLVLFPLVGVMSVKNAAAPYANSNVFLFMGGFLIALAIERWGLHRRIALHIVRIVGTSRATIVLGFMVASAALSMWISNTATTLMMIPIGLAIITAIGELSQDADEARHKNFAAALMLGIAYAASIGGVATPIGTPPNISFRGQLARLFPEAPEISFGQWLIAFMPLVILFLPAVWLVLVKITCPVGSGRMAVGRDVIREDLRRLGRMSGPEKCVLAVFLFTALLWMTRTIPVGQMDYGWAALFERLLRDGEAWVPFHAKYVNDATVAMGMAVLLFMIRLRKAGSGPRVPLMNWTTAQRLPWGILLLFGGGFSIAAGLRESGASMWCGQLFAGIGITNPVYIVIATCLMMTFLTEITSNTATTEVMLPILAGASGAMGFNPLLLMIPATISASCAFMMPVATPPNAIVFGSGHVEMGRMVRSGLIINFIGAALVTATFYFVVSPILGIDPTSIPEWAQ